MFFNLRFVSKSPTDISTPIGTGLELCSRDNLPSKSGPCFLFLTIYLQFHILKLKLRPSLKLLLDAWWWGDTHLEHAKKKTYLEQYSDN